jgi:uncharacterized protein Yka (UPF0111/DUF47 family)
MKLLDALLPREIKFYKYLNDQIDNFCHACKVFHELIINIQNLEKAEVLQYIDKIKTIETRGDRIEHFIIDKLHTTFITPIDREDIHDIVIHIDSSLDSLNTTSQKIETYRLKEIPPNIIKFSELICEAGNEIKKLLKCLEEKSDMMTVQKITDRVHDIENQCDDLLHISILELFKNEKDAIYIMKIKEIYEDLEITVDALDVIAKLIRGIVVKYG